VTGQGVAAGRGWKTKYGNWLKCLKAKREKMQIECLNARRFKNNVSLDSVNISLADMKEAGP
jgi:hypothetical protein